MKIHSYTISIDYFATGEGRHVWTGILAAEDEDQARRRFRDAFPDDFTDGDGWRYFSLGLNIKEGIDTKQLWMLSQGMLKFLENTDPSLRHMFFRFDINHS